MKWKCMCLHIMLPFSKLQQFFHQLSSSIKDNKSIHTTSFESSTTKIYVPLKAAICSGVPPSIFLESLSTWFWSKMWHASKWPLYAAVWSGVYPYLSLEFLSAWLFSKILHTSELPVKFAACNGVLCFSFLELMSTCFVSKKLQTFKWPERAAQWRGVSPVGRMNRRLV